jgi:dihydrofolate reductase
MITLDGVMQSPGGSKEDAAQGFNYGGWIDGYGNKEADKIYDTKIHAVPFDLLLGHTTYDIFATFWPKHADEPRWGKPFDKAKKYVVSHKPIELSWNNSELISGDVVEEIKKLKNTDGADLLIYGSGNLIQTLLKANLIDKMHIWTFPITIGTGKKLFADGTNPERFNVVDTKIISTGVIYASYEPIESLKAE